ncbi:MAG: type II secretion system protein GspN [Desulfuromonadales bacterium]|nr:MAG: type II secretion system protein GspN [Desulfuromonadales bacterium]
MTRRRLLYGGCGALACIFLILAFTVILVPSREIEGVIIRRLAAEGYTFHSSGFGKTFPLGIAAGGVTLADRRGVLLRLDRLRARIAIIPLLTGKGVVLFDGALGPGRIAGTAERDGATHIEARDIRLDDIPFFRTVADAQVKGILAADATFRGTGPRATGEIRLEVNGADVRSVKLGGTPIPDATYDRVRGKVRIGNGRATLDSVALQGEGIYIRLAGGFPLAAPLGASPLDLTLELMPQPAFLNRQRVIFALMTKYLVTPGQYRLPIRGTLDKPLLP